MSANDTTPNVPSPEPSLDRLVRRVREYEVDHGPDGWPAIQMKDLSELADAAEEQRKIVKICCREWAESHTYVQEVARRIGLSEYEVDGDSWGVPTIEDLVDRIVERLSAPNEPKVSDDLGENKTLNSLKTTDAQGVRCTAWLGDGWTGERAIEEARAVNAAYQKQFEQQKKCK